MTYNIITKKDIRQMIERLDQEIAFKEKDLPQCYVESKENTWKHYEEELNLIKERTLLYILLSSLRDQEAMDELNKDILYRRK